MTRLTDAELAGLLAGITPGPWETETDDVENWLPGIEADDRTTIVILGKREDVNDDSGIRGETDEQIVANAQAIARVPDLLADLIAAREALRKIAALIEEAHKEYADGPILDEAQAIIKGVIDG